AALMGGRWYVAGTEPEGLWKVTLTVSGMLDPQEVAFTTARPLDFRRQHIFQERFNSAELLHQLGKRGHSRRHDITWQRSQLGGPAAFQLQYSFRCDPGKKPTP